MITKKLLTEDLKFTRSSGKIHLKYKGKQLAVIAENVLFQLLLDSSPSSFIKDLAKVAGVTVPTVRPAAVTKLATVYVYKKLLHLGRKPTGLADPMVVTHADKLLSDKKTEAEFKKALSVMKDLSMQNASTFIDAQVEGLQFVNNGKGTFPTPSQLATNNAFDRALTFTATNSETKSSDKKVAKPKNYWFFNKEVDGNLSLEKNQKYKTALDNIEKGTATLEEAIYAQRCFSHRRTGQSYSKIERYIEKVSH